MKKVVLTGSESTGKSELARRLGEHFRAPVAPEFVRAFATERGGQVTFADLGAIAQAQMAGEDEAIAAANDLVILDTDLISTVVYAEHYYGQVPEWIEAQAAARLGHLYLLCAADIPWEPDGVRDRGDRRDELHELFRAGLRRFHAVVMEIRGDRDARFHAAADAIRRLTSTGRGQI